MAQGLFGLPSMAPNLKPMVAGSGRATVFLWKNNSLRSDIFFQQKTCTPPETGRLVSYSPWQENQCTEAPFRGLFPKQT